MVRDHKAKERAKEASIDDISRVLGDSARRFAKTWQRGTKVESISLYKANGSRDYRGNFESAYDGKVDIELHGLPRELAVAIARTIKDYEEGA
jgi:hypothetical protein